MTPEEVMPSGYDEQERFFHEKDVALLKKKREELDVARREREQQAAKAEHWMKCPKCGAGLQEIEMDGIMVDKCGGCEGIFFDRGELELMIESHKGGLGRLKKLFG
jgi:hypothetical protein